MPVSLVVGPLHSWLCKGCSTGQTGVADGRRGHDITAPGVLCVGMPSVLEPRGCLSTPAGELLGIRCSSHSLILSYNNGLVVIMSLRELDKGVTVSVQLPSEQVLSTPVIESEGRFWAAVNSCELLCGASLTQLQPYQEMSAPIKSLAAHKELGPIVFLSDGSVRAVTLDTAWSSSHSGHQLLSCGVTGGGQVFTCVKTQSELRVETYPGPNTTTRLPLIDRLNSVTICGDKLIATDQSGDLYCGSGKGPWKMVARLEAPVELSPLSDVYFLAVGGEGYSVWESVHMTQQLTVSTKSVVLSCWGWLVSEGVLSAVRDTPPLLLDCLAKRTAPTPSTQELLQLDNWSQEDCSVAKVTTANKNVTQIMSSGLVPCAQSDQLLREIWATKDSHLLSVCLENVRGFSEGLLVELIAHLVPARNHLLLLLLRQPFNESLVQHHIAAMPSPVLKGLLDFLLDHLTLEALLGTPPEHYCALVRWASVLVDSHFSALSLGHGALVADLAHTVRLQLLTMSNLALFTGLSTHSSLALTKKDYTVETMDID